MSKLEIYLEICKNLVEGLSKVENKDLDELLVSYKDGIKEIEEWKQAKKFPVSKASILTGLEQGVNELPVFFEDLPTSKKQEAFNIYYQTLNSVVPNYAEKLELKINKIVSRGRILNDSEYYLLRQRLEDVEGKSIELESTLDQILAKYDL